MHPLRQDKRNVVEQMATEDLAIVYPVNPLARPGASGCENSCWGEQVLPNSPGSQDLAEWFYFLWSQETALSIQACIIFLKTVLLKAGNHIGWLSSETPLSHGMLNFDCVGEATPAPFVGCPVLSLIYLSQCLCTNFLRKSLQALAWDKRGNSSGTAK